MRIGWNALVVLFACTLSAQTLSADLQLLSAHAETDRDVYGRGSPSGFAYDNEVLKRNSDVTMVETEDRFIYPEESEASVVGSPRGADLYFSRLLRSSDIAVTAVVLRQKAIFNTNKTHIVTDSLMQVDQIYTNKRGINLQSGTELVVTQSGGTVQINNHLATLTNAEFPLLPLGSTCFLFLHLNPTTGSYFIEPKGAFLISGDIVKALYKGDHPAAAYLSDKHTFLTTVRAVASKVTQ